MADGTGAGYDNELLAAISARVGVLVIASGGAGKPEHLLLADSGIPVVQTNRGGQITYHGPGQIVAYPLLDLQRRGYFVKEFVYKIEESLIRTLAEFGLTGHRLRGAPGV